MRGAVRGAARGVAMGAAMAVGEMAAVAMEEAMVEGEKVAAAMVPHTPARQERVESSTPPSHPMLHPGQPRR